MFQNIVPDLLTTQTVSVSTRLAFKNKRRQKIWVYTSEEKNSSRYPLFNVVISSSPHKPLWSENLKVKRDCYVSRFVRDSCPSQAKSNFGYLICKLKKASLCYVLIKLFLTRDQIRPCLDIFVHKRISYFFIHRYMEKNFMLKI